MIASVVCGLVVLLQPAPGEPEQLPAQLPIPEEVEPAPVPIVPLVLAVPSDPVAVRGRLEVSAGGARRQQVIEAWFRQGPLPELRIEVGPFLIHAVTLPTSETAVDGGTGEIRSTITVVHTGDRGSFVTHEFPGPLSLGRLHEVVPPIPLPQLAQWLEGGAVRLPGQASVAWQAPMPGEGGMRRLVGETPDGPALATTEGERLRSWRQPIRVGERIAVLELEMEFAAPPPGPWAIDLGSRRQLERLSALQPSNSTIARFQPVPALPIFGMDRQAWTLPSITVERAAGQAEPFSVLLLTRAVATDIEPVAEAMADAVDVARSEIAVRFDERRAAGDRPTPVEVGAWTVLVFELSEFSFPALEDAGARLATQPTGVLWSASPAATLGRFAPGAERAVVVIDGYRRLVAVLDPAREDLAIVLTEAITREAWLDADGAADQAPGEQPPPGGQPPSDASAGDGG